MATFTQVTSHAVPLIRDDIDTDQIIPARFLKVTDKEGLGKNLFCDWRYLNDGSDNPDFELNQASAKGAKILLAANNFGTGSSREHAPWALTGWGFSVVIAMSFADIFKNNALKNGLLPVLVDEAIHSKLLAAIKADPKATISIDLPSQTLTAPDGATCTFPVDSFAKHCLLEGIDQLTYLQSFEKEIASYESSRGY